MIRYAGEAGAHVAFDVRPQTAGEPRDLLLVSDGFVPIDLMDELPSLARAIRRLATFARVIRFDRRGVGLSDPLPPDRPPSLDDWVDDALRVLDASGSVSTTVVGSTETGAVATRFAAAHPDRVTSLVLINSAARATSAPGYEVGYPVELVEALIESGTEVDGEDTADGTLDLIAPSVVDDPVFRRWWIRAGRSGASPLAARALLRLSYLADVRDVLPAIRVPVLVVRRRDDPLVTDGLARYLASHVEDGRFVEVPGADDLWYVGETDPILDEIERFVTGDVAAVDGDRVHATIVMTDIVGSTSMIHQVGDDAWRAMLDAHDDLVRRELARADGREVKSTGDGFLLTFEHPADALTFAERLHRGALPLNLRLRIAIHAGQVDVRHDDIGGANVHAVARVAALAAPGQTLVTATARHGLTEHAAALVAHGQFTLRGFSTPWDLYRVVEPSFVDPAPGSTVEA